jgi:hypothetical protein
LNDPTRIPSHGDWQGPGPPANIRRSGSLRRAATVTVTDSESELPALSPIIQGLRSVTPSPYRLDRQDCLPHHLLHPLQPPPSHPPGPVRRHVFDCLSKYH